MKYSVIIPSAGSGQRMKVDHNKLLLPLGDKTVIERTVQVFANDEYCQEIILVVKESEKKQFMQACFSYSAKIKFAIGGLDRQQSVKNGLKIIEKDCKTVLVHDGARPLIMLNYVHKVIKNALHHGASVLAVKVKDTIKQAFENTITQTLNRENLWSIQTPQAFSVELLVRAHNWAEAFNYTGTDEASLVEMMGVEVIITPGSYENIKITTIEDIWIAEAILAKRSEEK